MGGSISKRRSGSQRSYSRSSSHSWSYPPPQSPYVQQSQDCGPCEYFGTPSQTYGGGCAPESRKRLEEKYSKIDDNYISLDQVTEALAGAGLESSNLIVGIDFTKSNEWTGAKSFQRRSLHQIGHE